MIITTACKYNIKIVSIAKEISTSYNLPFVERKKRSIQELFDTYESNVLMVGSEKIELHTSKGTLKYHPNFAQVRIKRLLKGETDPFIEATGLKEDSSIIDCTMGMLSDSLVASYVVGITGSVTAVETIRDVHVTISSGAYRYRHTIEEINRAAERIKTKHINAYQYLSLQEDASVDVVYFDPMFEETIQSSSGLQSLEALVSFSELTHETVQEARRVAKKRVVLKAHFRSQLFEEHGFIRCIRPSSVLHYGVIVK